MSSLDDKLEEILSDAYDEGVSDFRAPTGLFDDIGMVAQIKQAFADEGWLSPEQSKAAIDIKKHIKGCMTGQEFYDRFEKEYRILLGLTDDERTIRSGALEAAKRAAGLEEKS